MKNITCAHLILTNFSTEQKTLTTLKNYDRKNDQIEILFDLGIPRRKTTKQDFFNILRQNSLKKIIAQSTNSPQLNKPPLNIDIVLGTRYYKAHLPFVIKTMNSEYESEFTALTPFNLKELYEIACVIKTSTTLLIKIEFEK